MGKLKTIKKNYQYSCGPLTIKDGNGRTLETEHQIAGAFAHKLEKQFQISEEEDADFDQEFALGINAEWQNRKPPTIDEATPEDMGDEGTLEEGFTLEDVNTALKSFGEKAPGASGISKLYLTQAPENIRRTLTMVYNVALALGHFRDASNMRKW